MHSISFESPAEGAIDFRLVKSFGVFGSHYAHLKYLPLNHIIECKSTENDCDPLHNVRFHFKFSGLKKLVKLNGYEIGKITINFNENTIF